MALCGLDLREYRREAVLVHWADPKPLLGFLLHCHSHCSYCQSGLERGMGLSRCTLPCPSWPSAGGPAPVLWTTVGMCFVLHTGRVMPGDSSQLALGVLKFISGVRVSLCSVLVRAGMATKLRRGDTASGLWAVHLYLVGCSGATATHHWLCGCTWHL